MATKLFMYDNNEVYLCTGKYGNYLTWKTYKISMGTLNKLINNNNINMINNPIYIQDYIVNNFSIIADYMITQYDLKPKIEILKRNHVRQLTPEIFISKGKYNLYISYIPTHTYESKSYSLSGFNNNPMHCSIEMILTWIHDTHGI